MTHSDKSSGTVFALLTLLLGCVLFYWYVTDYFSENARVSATDGQVLVLKQSRDGHYYANGRINGYEVRFMVDTGATSVALSEKLAREIGLRFGAKSEGMTANGVTTQWLTSIDHLEIAGVGMRGVPAAILPNMDDDVLLGMSFLRHFEWQQRDGRLQLSPK